MFGCLYLLKPPSSSRLQASEYVMMRGLLASRHVEDDSSASCSLRCSGVAVAMKYMKAAR